LKQIPRPFAASDAGSPFGITNSQLIVTFSVPSLYSSTLYFGVLEEIQASAFQKHVILSFLYTAGST